MPRAQSSPGQSIYATSSRACVSPPAACSGSRCRIACHRNVRNRRCETPALCKRQSDARPVAAYRAQAPHNRASRPNDRRKRSTRYQCPVPATWVPRRTGASWRYRRDDTTRTANHDPAHTASSCRQCAPRKPRRSNRPASRVNVSSPPFDPHGAIQPQRAESCESPIRQQRSQRNVRNARRIKPAQFDTADAVTHVVDTDGLLRRCTSLHVEHLALSRCTKKCRFHALCKRLKKKCRKNSRTWPTMCHVPCAMCHVPCAIVLHVVYHVPYVPCAMCHCAMCHVANGPASHHVARSNCPRSIPRTTQPAHSPVTRDAILRKETSAMSARPRRWAAKPATARMKSPEIGGGRIGQTIGLAEHAHRLRADIAAEQHRHAEPCFHGRLHRAGKLVLVHTMCHAIPARRSAVEHLLLPTNTRRRSTQPPATPRPASRLNPRAPTQKSGCVHVSSGAQVDQCGIPHPPRIEAPFRKPVRQCQAESIDNDLQRHLWIGDRKTPQRARQPTDCDVFQHAEPHCAGHLPRAQRPPRIGAPRRGSYARTAA